VSSKKKKKDIAEETSEHRTKTPEQSSMDDLRFDTVEKVKAEFERKKSLRTVGVRIHTRKNEKKISSEEFPEQTFPLAEFSDGDEKNISHAETEKKTQAENAVSKRKEKKKNKEKPDTSRKKKEKRKDGEDTASTEADDGNISEEDELDGFDDIDVDDVEILREEDKKEKYELPSACAAFFSRLSDWPLLSAEEERELAEKVAKGDKEAFERFVMSNARLAVACVKDISRRMGGNTILDFMDLAQEAVLGLMTAVERFDPNRGVRFSTYGMYWIYQRVKRALVSQRKGMTVPGFAGESVFAMGDYIALYCEGREDLVPRRNLPRVKDLARLVGRMACFGDSEEREECGSDVVDEETISSGDDASTPGGDESMSVFLRDDFSRLLDSLTTPVEADMLRRKFGLYPYNSPESYKEIALVHGKSSETVRSMVDSMLTKLRRSRRVEKFAAEWLK